MKLSEKNILIGSMLLSVFVLLLTHLVVTNDGVFLDREPYFHAKAASLIIENDFQYSKEITAHGREYDLEPFHYVLAGSAMLTGLENASNSIPILTGIFTILLFSLLLRDFVTKDLRITGTCLLAISPVFIYNHTIAQGYGIAVPLSLAAFYFLKQNNLSKYIGVLLAVITGFFEPILAIICIIPLVLYYQQNKFASVKILIAAITATIISLIIRSYIFPFKSISIGNNFLVDNINIFGALVGFSFFTIILAFTGLIHTWNNKRQYIPLYALILLIIASATIFPGLKIILNLIFSFLGAKGFVTLLNMKWELKIIRTLSTIIVIVGMIFSTGLYMNNLQQSSPSGDLITSLNFLQANSLDDEIVLSHWKNQYWIEYYAQRKAFSTDNLTIFKTRDEKKALEILTANNISYILVDLPTRNLMKTERNNLGLEFVMENSDRFKKMITYNQTVVWAII